MAPHAPRRPRTPASSRPMSFARLAPLLLCGSAAVAGPLGRAPSLVLARPGAPQHVLGAAADRPDSGPRRLRGKFLHITDLHPDEFYRVHASTSDEDACHRGKGSAGVYGAETSGCDTPYSLINATFDWIAANLRDEVDFVVWTGDSARHDSDEQLPRSPAQIQDANQVIADKFADAFRGPGGGLAVPVVPTLGNNDILPHNVLLPGPNKWLKRYTDIWRRFIPQEQRHAFAFGGWYYVEVIPGRLAVFSLNTLYFFDRNAGIDDCVKPSEPGFKQLEWLRVQLQFMRERGVKAILTGHVPPARTGSKQLWDETCWQKYTLWLRQYRDVVVGSLYGHMNIDHFLLHDTEDLNYRLLGGAPDGVGDYALHDGGDAAIRAPLEDEMDIRSTTDYLQELRSGWSKLPRPLLVAQNGETEEEGDDGDDEHGDVGTTGGAEGGAGKTKKGKHSKGHKKGRKNKGPKLSRKWSERYQLSLVGPSVVPNYLPSLRVIEYNITGLEDVSVWVDGPSRVPVLADDGHTLAEDDVEGSKKKKKSGKDKKNNKKKKKGDPNLTVPSGPSKAAVPGPAYSVQPLTLLGYTQYFANLTHINNEAAKAETAKPHTLQYKVEYSTFTDKIYNLSDMTVNSFMEMAYRMGKKAGKTGSKAVDEVADADDLGDVDEAGKKKKKKKKKQNEVWLHFLRHAFVSSVDSEKLKKIGG